MDVDEHDPRAEPLSIFDAASICCSQLEQCCTSPALDEDHWAENRLADFNLWNAGVGATAKKCMSLDIRLQHDDAARNVIIGVLSTLTAWTKKCSDLAADIDDPQPQNPPPSKLSGPILDVSAQSKADEPGQRLGAASPAPHESEDEEPEITLAEAKDSVGELLHTLVVIGLAIRRAGNASRHRQADRAFESDSKTPEYEDLRGHLEFLLRLPLLLEERKALEAQKAPEAETKGVLGPEQLILIRATLQRRHRIRFSQGRAMKLKELPLQSREERSTPHTTVAPSLGMSHSTKSDDFGRNSRNTPKHENATASEKHARSNVSKPSDYNVVQSLEQQIQTRNEGVAATIIAMHSDYPKPPQIDGGTQLFQCPYCCLTFPTELSKETSFWRKHVSEDIQPYTCFLPTCSMQNANFNTLEEWKSHIGRDHRLSEYWRCFVCEDRFEDEASFSAHIKTWHAEVIPADDLSAMAQICLTYDTPRIDICPICSINKKDWEKNDKAEGLSIIPGTTSFLDHIGQCLHDFSLRSLPDGASTDRVHKSFDAVQSVSNQTPRSYPASSFDSTEGSEYENDIDLTRQILDPIPKRYKSVEKSCEVWREEALSGSEPEPPTDLQEQPESLLDSEEPSLEAILRENEVQHVNEHVVFWPHALLERLITKKRVFNALALAGIERDEAEALCGHIINEPGAPKWKPYLRIFAALVLIEMPTDIQAFINSGLCDYDLPLKRSAINKICKRWRKVDVEYFMMTQFRVNVPYFDMAPENKAKHYDIQPGTILPWITPDDESKDKGREMMGGYGTVQRYRIDPDSHGFHVVLKSVGLYSDWVAVKCLRQSKGQTDFGREVDNLIRFSGLVHRSLITLLATYTLGGRYNLVFPAAECDLDDYWRRMKGPLDRIEPKNMDVGEFRWISEQILSIIEGLHFIHKASQTNTDMEEKFGRHGDLKPENILWFKSPESPRGMFVITDFGSADVRGRRSMSDVADGGLPNTPMYRPPECDIDGGRISRAYDVWTLGCVLLEMVCWLLGGQEEREDFEDARMSLYVTRVQVKTFFDILKIAEGEYAVQLKPAVFDRIESLQGRANCTPYVYDLLELIGNGMLVTLQTGRMPARRLLEEVMSMHERTSRVSYIATWETRAPSTKRQKPFSVTLNKYLRNVLTSHGTNPPPRWITVLIRARYVDQAALEVFLGRLFPDVSEVKWSRGLFQCKLPRCLTQTEQDNLAKNIELEYYAEA